MGKHNTRGKIVKREKATIRSNKKYGSQLGYLGGDKHFGPVTKEKGEIEFQRLINVYNSIRNDKYRINENGIDNISALILSSKEIDDELRFFIVRGQHRIAALTALGYHYIDLQIQMTPYGGVIRREESANWPLVLAGYLSNEEALSLFDRIFQAEFPINFEQAIWGKIGIKTVT